MNSGIKTHQIGFQSLLVLAMLINVVSQAVHETGHPRVFQLMGHNPVWGFTSLVQVWDIPRSNPDEWVETTGSDGERGWLKLSSPVASKAEGVLSSAAGPLAGLLSAVLGFGIARRSKKLTLKQLELPLAMIAVLYYLRNPLRTSGDEYAVAMRWGVATPLIVFPLAFAACLILALHALPLWHVRLKWLGTVLLGRVATGLLMVSADPFIIAQVEAGNPWFQPIFGYSSPVFLV